MRARIRPGRESRVHADSRTRPGQLPHDAARAARHSGRSSSRSTAMSTSAQSVPPPTAAVDPARLDAFIGHFLADLGGAFHAGMAVIGEELGLYKVLAHGPLTAAQ